MESDMCSLMKFKKSLLLIIACPLSLISMINIAQAQTITMEQCFQEMMVLNPMYPMQLDAYTEIVGSACYLNISGEVSQAHNYNILVDTSTLPPNVPDTIKSSVVAYNCSNPQQLEALMGVGEITNSYYDKITGNLYTSFTMSSKDC